MPSASSLLRLEPASAEEAAEQLAAAAARGDGVRIAGGGSRRGWGRPLEDPDVELATGSLDRIVEHNAGDLTAVLEAGVPVRRAQEAFAQAGQMLALDAPEGTEGEPTIGGLVATADSGPMRQRYGGVRDLILGVTVALSDGTVARAGGRVIKNVAGYDLAKLFSGAFGTLGVVVEAVFRLQPLPAQTATAVGHVRSPEALAAAAAALRRAPLELMCLDLAWQDGRGAVLARAGGRAVTSRAEHVAEMLARAGADADVLDDDDALWRAQRAAQRAAPGGTVVRVSSLPGEAAEVTRAAQEHGARLVGRAALGLYWLSLESRGDGEAAEAVGRLRARLAPSPCVVLDAPAGVREALDPWGGPEGPELELMRRLKRRFDPTGTCNPGIFVGGI